MHDVRREVVLGSVLLPVLNQVLEWAVDLGVGMVCCAVEAGAVTHWRSAVYDGLAEQVGEVGDMLALRMPDWVQKGFRSVAKAAARLFGYSAVSALT